MTAPDNPEPLIHYRPLAEMPEPWKPPPEQQEPTMPDEKLNHPPLTALDWEGVYSARVSEARKRLRLADESLDPPFTRLRLLCDAKVALEAAIAWCASNPPDPPKVAERGA